MRAPQPVPHDSWPGLTWRTASPAEVGLDPALPERLTAWMQAHPYIHGLALVRAGALVIEMYGKTTDQRRAFDQHQYFNVNSVTKSVTSALVGIAIGEGRLALDDTLVALFPEEEATIATVGAQGVTVRHLLSMTSGYQLVSNDVDTFLHDARSLAAMLGRPLEHAPGTVWAYDDLGAHLLALALERRVGTHLALYAQERLFTPIGIWRDESGGEAPWRRGRQPDEPHPYGLRDTRHDLLWSVDAAGHNIGGFGLQLTIPEMARFGYLFLCGGE